MIKNYTANAKHFGEFDFLHINMSLCLLRGRWSLAQKLVHQYQRGIRSYIADQSIPNGYRLCWPFGIGKGFSQIL